MRLASLKILSCLVVAAGNFVHAETVKDREGAVRGDKARVWLKDAPEDGSAVVLRVTQDGAERFYQLAL